MRKLSVLFLSILVLSQTLWAQPIQKLSGLAVSVNLQSQMLNVMFSHPVTGERILKSFVVLPSTGFKNVKRLDQIEPNDPVSVDYEENGDGELHAIYIEVIELEKVPFSRNELPRFLR